LRQENAKLSVLDIFRRSSARQRQPGNLPAKRIKARNYDTLRRFDGHRVIGPE
jgi:hypothetical protein